MKPRLDHHVCMYCINDFCLSLFSLAVAQPVHESSPFSTAETSALPTSSSPSMMSSVAPSVSGD